jgi:transposase-like protein
MVYSAEFRETAIRRYDDVGSYWRAARDVGVSIATLHRWVRLLEEAKRTQKESEDVDADADENSDVKENNSRVA